MSEREYVLDEHRWSFIPDVWCYHPPGRGGYVVGEEVGALIDRIAQLEVERGKLLEVVKQQARVTAYYNGATDYGDGPSPNRHYNKHTARWQDYLCKEAVEFLPQLAALSELEEKE